MDNIKQECFNNNKELFSLKWENHQSAIFQNFENLLKSEIYTDCTLGAEGKYLKVHKVIISSCSVYFQNLLSEHYDKHPIIILKDVKFDDLKALVEYIYKGHVNIYQNQLDSFFSTANSLSINGFSNTDLKNNLKNEFCDEAKLMLQNSSIASKIGNLEVSFDSSEDIEILMKNNYHTEGEDSPSLKNKENSNMESPALSHEKYLNSHENIRFEQNENSINYKKCNNYTESAETVPSSGIPASTNDPIPVISAENRLSSCQELKSLVTSQKNNKTDLLPESSVNLETLNQESDTIKKNKVSISTEEKMEDEWIINNIIDGDLDTNIKIPISAKLNKNNIKKKLVNNKKSSKKIKLVKKLKVNKSRVVSKKKVFKCEKCEKTYTSQKTLYRHINFDCGNPKQFACNFCILRFNRQYQLDQHMEKFHEENALLFD